MSNISVIVNDSNNITAVVDQGVIGPQGPIGPPGPGDVDGPASATDNAVARFDGTTGKLIQNSVVTIDDTGNMAGVGTLAVTDLTDASLISGRVTYAGAGGNLVDSANLTFNGTDLTVSGAVNAGSINATTLDLTNLEVTNIKSKDGTASITLADSTGVASFTANPMLSGGTANGVAYLNGSKVLTTGSALTFDGTNLDLATVGAKLNFATTGSATRNYVGGSADGYSLEMVMQRGASQPISYKQDFSAAAHIYGIGGSEQMRLTSTGLGIGTSSPAQKLHVYTASGVAGFQIQANAYSANYTLYAGAGGANAFGLYDNTANAYRYIVDSSGNLCVGSSSAGNAGTLNASVGNPGTTTGGLQLWSTTTGSHTIQWGDGTSGSDTYRGAIEYAHSGDTMRFYTSSTEQMRLTSTGLGIGTSSPSFKLDVSGANAQSIRVTSTNGDLANLVMNSTGNASWSLSSDTVMRFKKDSTEYMRLDSSGNLGIGTSSPSEKLVVSGGCLQVTGNLQSLNRPSSSVMDFLSGATRFFSIGANSSTYGSFSFRNATTTTNTEVMAIDSSGNLGLGVTPSAWGSGLKALQIGPQSSLNSGDTAFTAATRLSTNAYSEASAVFKRIDSGFATSYYQQSGFHFWETAGSSTAGSTISFTQAMTLDASGNLGVGTTSPVAKVHIAADNDTLRLASTTGTAATFARFINTGQSFYIGLDNSAGSAFNSPYAANIYGSGAYPMVFWTNSTERARITSGGDFGIGTTTPASALQVLRASANPTVNLTRTTSSATTLGEALYLRLNDSYGNTGMRTEIGMGYGVPGTNTYTPAVIGYVQTSGASNTYGDIYFATRGVTTDTAPTERARIDSSGNFFINGTTQIAGSKLNVLGDGAYIGVGGSTVQLLIGDNGQTDGFLGTFTNHALTIRTNNTERARIDSSGNFGIGTSSPSTYAGASGQLVVYGGVGTTFTNNPANMTLVNNGTIAAGLGTGINFSANYNDSITTTYAVISGIRENATSGSPAGALVFGTRDSAGSVTTERARITSGGDFLVGTTSTNETSGTGGRFGADGYVRSTRAGSTGAASTLDVYSTGASAFRFYVDMAGTVFATNTTISAISDQRLKENVQDLDAGLDKIMALKPRKFDWKKGKGKNIKGDRGWIAQEFEQVFPDMIDTWKDEAPEGEEPYKSVRADLIPVLVKAIQEQQAIITALTARVAALESI